MLNYLQLSIYKALTAKVILRQRFGEMLWNATASDCFRVQEEPLTAVCKVSG